MNINDIANTLSASLSTTAGKAARRNEPSQDPLERALNLASQRVEEKKQQTEVKLSSLGQVKSAVSNLEKRSEALTQLNQTSADPETTPAEKQQAVRSAAEGFVTAFNNARQTLDKAIKGENRSAGALADEGRTRITANELSRTLSSSTQNELKAIGINVQQNGTLKLDSQKFAQAQQANPEQVSRTLAQAGQETERTTARQLGNNGNIERSINTLSRQVQALESEQETQRNLTAALQRATETASDRLNATNAAGIAAYQRIFNL